MTAKEAFEALVQAPDEQFIQSVGLVSNAIREEALGRPGGVPLTLPLPVLPVKGAELAHRTYCAAAVLRHLASQRVTISGSERIWGWDGLAREAKIWCRGLLQCQPSQGEPWEVSVSLEKARRQIANIFQITDGISEEPLDRSSLTNVVE